MIEQIETLSKIASEFSNFAKMPLAENEHFVVNELVASVYTLFTENETQAHRIVLDLSPHPLEIFADKSQIMRVLTNLVKNGLQAIPDQRKGEVRIRLFRREQTAVISVKDNGTGIPPDMREKVFFPNFTTKTSGMGLGLAISKSIIEAAGGRIYFETETGKGTTFFVELPIVPAIKKS